MSELIIPIEGYNVLAPIKNVPYNGYEQSKNNVLYELTTFENSKFVITANNKNDSLLSAYSQYDMGGHPAGVATIYELTNEKRENSGAIIHQAFFKLSGDGALRKLGLQAWQMEEIITSNEDLFPKGKDWIAYFLIESNPGIYPISVRPFRHNAELYEIGLESLSDLTFYAAVRDMYFIARKNG